MFHGLVVNVYERGPLAGGQWLGWVCLSWGPEKPGRARGSCVPRQLPLGPDSADQAEVPIQSFPPQFLLGTEPTIPSMGFKMSKFSFPPLKVSQLDTEFLMNQALSNSILHNSVGSLFY